MIPILLIITASFRPAIPTVGDPITIRFPAAVRLDASPNYEIVSQRGNVAVIRTFQPGAFTISGVAGTIRFRHMTVPVRSVLKPNDSMTPAGLKPPRKEPYPRAPFMAIGIAALAAIAAWVIAALRPARVKQRPAAAPADRFRSRVLALRPGDWAKLADAVREYLEATTLTTTEALERHGPLLIAEILHQGDLQKFSPWGPQPADFDAMRQRALEIAA